MPGLAAGRYFHTATLLPDGKVLIAGGTHDGDKPMSSAELYDPAAVGARVVTGRK
jgi:hypothetical protein